MSFSYDYYMANTFTWPLIGCIIFGIIIIGSLVKIFVKPKSLFNLENLMNFLLIIVFMFGLVTNLGHLSYGYKIVLDEKDNVATIEGDIEKIEENIYAPLYKLDGGNSRGHTIYISGESYYIMSAKDLSVNDNVEITYLKNSKFILEIIVQE